MSLSPRAGGLYRILDVLEPDYQHLIGKCIVLDSTSPGVRGFYKVVGRVQGEIGSFDITAMLTKVGIPVCTCLRFDFPHQRTVKCKVTKGQQHGKV